jgi:hypothetical protein
MKCYLFIRRVSGRGTRTEFFRGRSFFGFRFLGFSSSAGFGGRLTISWFRSWRFGATIDGDSGFVRGHFLENWD